LTSSGCTAVTGMSNSLLEGSNILEDSAKKLVNQASFDSQAMADRVRKLAQGKNLNAQELGRLLDVKKGSAANYWNGDSIWPTDKLLALATLFNVNTRWLLSGEGPRGAGEAGSEEDAVLVQEIDLAYGMGSTYLDFVTLEPKTIPFPRSWLRTFTSSDPEHLFFARGDGDSMMPTILDQDIVLIDRSQIAINRQDRIWAVAYGDLGMIKRVRAMPDGSYQLLSDNPNVEPAVAVDGEMSVIGRVVAVIRRT